MSVGLKGGDTPAMALRDAIVSAYDQESSDVEA